MAHLVDGKGPYPDKAGEYCGNYRPDSTPTRIGAETPQQALQSQAQYLSQMRFGQPLPAGGETSEELQSRGWVGLYLKEDCKLSSAARPGQQRLGDGTRQPPQSEG